MFGQAHYSSGSVALLVTLSVVGIALSPAVTLAINTELAADGDSLGLSDVVFVVLSQSNVYHARRSQVFKQHILDQTQDLAGEPVLHLLHEKWARMGAWTVFPILPDITEEYGTMKTVFICEEETRLDLKELLANLGQYDFSQELFLGRALRDRQATVIHHYAFHTNPEEFAYPDFAAGFVLSMPLVKKIVEQRKAQPIKMGFTIDNKHELAMYIRNDGEGTLLTEAQFLCAGNEHDECSSSYPTKFPKCGEAVSDDDIFIVVKTCEKFHSERVPVVQRTWGRHAKHLEFASETEDRSIPTISLGVNNTERGHCTKFMAILDRARNEEHISSKDWLVVVDDDTLLSVPRLKKLLACYDPREPVALGERYGYGSAAGQGYDYITGGGGTVLSFTAVEQLVDSGTCRCGGHDSPDDMTLGMCLRRLAIPVTHSPLFHQARPDDYSQGYLSHQIPVSFHKHSHVDPYQVYNKWLADVTHDEL